TLWSPADCDSILAVGSVTSGNVISSFSSRGPTFDGRGKPDLVAQGENTIWAENDHLGSYPGTSLAAPLVSGAAGLVQEAHPEWSGQQVRYALKSTADKATTGDSTTYGLGRPDVVKAIYGSTLGGPVFPKPFALASPANLSSVASPPVTLQWRRTVDPNGDALTYTVQLRQVSPSVLVYSSTTADTSATYSGALIVGMQYEWNVTATDPAGHGRLAQEPFRFTRAGGIDNAPIVSAAATVNDAEGVSFSFPVSAGDPDGDPIDSLMASSLPPGATFTDGGVHTDGTFSWIPDFTQAGTYNVTFTAQNALSGSTVTQIIISNVDRAPGVTAPVTVSGTAGSVISFSISATDPDGQAVASLTMDASGLPAGNDAALTPDGSNTTGSFLWHSQLPDSGTFSVSFQASNALNGSASTSIKVSEGGVSGVEDLEATTGPPRIARFQSRPNPFQTTTQIEVRMAGVRAGGNMSLRVYDVRGRLVRTLLNGSAPVSTHVAWDGTTETGERAASGVYYYRVEVANLREIRRLILLK
ncbi:MAG: S8 family serine peptidase, partial [Candidatus Eiseniibacteriota bacterium]